MKKADVLFSQYIRKRDGKCMRCGKDTTLQCAHYFGRRNRRLRYDPQNSITLCYSCHIFWAHKEPHEFVEWFREKFPKNYEYLLKVRNEVEKIDYEEVIESLQKLLESMDK